jgi:peptidoglycan/LPS O-acetylase OafA/YrhL
MRPILAAALYAGNYWAVFRGFHFLPGFTPFWSLAVEEHFYLCFPLAFVLMGRAKLSYKVQALALATVCAIVLAWRLTLVLGMGVVNEDRLLFSTDTRVDMMLFGCILALGMNPVLDEKAKPSLSLSALAVIAILVTVVVRNPIMHAAVRYSLQGLALIPLFTVAILSHKWYTNWLNWRLLRFVGTLSYALYLIHLAILDTVREHIRSMPVVATLVTLAVSFAYAYLMKIGVEAPINRLRKKFRNTREETSSGKGPAATEATFQLGAFGVAEE